MQLSRFLTSRTILPVLLLVWLAVQLFLYSRHGVFTDLEAAKYIWQADYFIEHGKTDGANYWFYLVQILLLALAKITHIGFVGAYILQLLINITATYFLYQLLKKLSNTNVAGLLTLCYILNIPLQTYNNYLQTESVYFSMVIFYSYRLFSFTSWKLKALLITCCLLAILCIIRPVGMYFIPGTYLYIWLKFYRGVAAWKIFSLAGLLLAAAFVLLNFAMGLGGEWHFMHIFENRMIICGVSEFQQKIPGKPGDAHNSLAGYWYYISNNTIAFLQMGWRKTLAFFGVYRSYYSLMHNVFIVAIIYPFYIMAAAGIKTMFRQYLPVAVFSVVIIFITWLSVFFTCDDWHNRFLLSVMVFFYILSVPVGKYLLSLKK